jgi:urease accessory protein
MTADNPIKSQGRLDCEFDRRGGASYVAHAFQSGCLRARPLATNPTDLLTVAVINTAGGLTGGDQLDQQIVWRGGAEATITTPAAEKIYRAAAGSARVAVNLAIDRDCVAEWLPQETIVFDGAALERTFEIHLVGNASIVASEAIVFGRLARGERLGTGKFVDQLKVFRDGRLVLFDRTDVAGHLGEWLDRCSTAHAYRCSAMVLAAGQGAEAFVPEIRECLDRSSELGGVSLVRGIVHVRVLASDDVKLRRVVAEVLGIARHGRDLPRSWSC